MTRSVPDLQLLRGKLLAAARTVVPTSADAEDIVQTALLRAFEQSQQLPDDVNWIAWLRTVTRNLGIDLARSRARRAEVGGCDEIIIAERSSEPDPQWLSITPEQLHSAWVGCEPLHREIFELRVVNGLSYKEIAKRLDIPMGTVATRLYRARDRVRTRLGVTGACAAISGNNPL